MLFGNEPNLEGILSGDAICKTYEITIPGYENAYNPSIVPYKDGYLLSFRYVARFPEWSKDIRFVESASIIGLALLDKQFQVKKKSVQLLEVQSFSDDFSIYAEDGRLFVFQDRIFLVFNDFPEPSPEYKRQLYLAEITHENGRWISKKRALRLFVENMSRIEKNWVPFSLNQSLYFIYGENSHTILSCDLSTGCCRKIDEGTLNWDWPYGLIRGGTPAIKIGDQFLSFFHSSILLPVIHGARMYYMGAYTFDASFPFTVRSYTPLPIGLKEYYKKTSSKKHASKRVVFPGGIVREGNMIHVAWGKDDKLVMVTTLDLEKLLKSMKKISY